MSSCTSNSGRDEHFKEGPSYKIFTERIRLVIVSSVIRKFILQAIGSSYKVPRGIGFFAWQACTERAGVQKRATLGTLMLVVKFKLSLYFCFYTLYLRVILL